jgi:ribosome biogenesis GTPase
MPRRHLSEQQLKRIRAIQTRRRERRETRTEEQLATSEAAPSQAGLVVARHGANLAVERADGAIFHCVNRRHVGEPVCGDRVIWQPTGSNAGIITALEPRETLLSRPDGAGRDKPLAANLTRMLIVCAPEPPPAGDLIDQYLIAAEHIGVAAHLLCNKADRLRGTVADEFLASLSVYTHIGYPLLPISALDGMGLDALRDQLSDGISLLVGQSGVGKSSITQTLLPEQEVQIGHLSRATGRGRHTTSTASCYRLPGGGHLIDSPGVRSFRLPNLGLDELAAGLREFRHHLGHCRFANCHHQAEPGCAIRAAVAAGQISPERLAVFHRLRHRLTETENQ